MPTANRRRFVPEAIRLFLAQDYRKKELIVLDDGEDIIADLIPTHPEIRYLRLDRHRSLGAKRNIACEVARGGIIAHWDDDDWYAPWRLSRQVFEIAGGETDLCGLARVLFFNPSAHRAWEYVYPVGAPPWVYGATFCYRKSLWRQSPFLDVTGYEDNAFIAGLTTARLRILPEIEMFVGLVHSANSSPKRTEDQLWHPQPVRRIQRAVGDNWAQMPLHAPNTNISPPPIAALSASLGAATMALGVLSVSIDLAYANPKGGQVSAGSASINQTSSSRLDIVQSTDRAAIDWQSFSIAPNEQTNFQQPAPTSVTLNRVAPGDPSVIAGRLTANGGVVLVNPSGITFSKGAVVDVNSIVATPTNISNANFMTGNMRFDQPSTDPRATVVNRGTITVAQKGLAALVGPAVGNSGVIQAKLGKVVLGGAQTYTLDFYGDGLISFDVGPKVTTAPTGPDGQPVKSLVSHTGQIDAPGGTVLLTADAAAGIIQNVVDAPGQITARGNGQVPGRVTIDAGAGGGANLSGTIDVSGLNQGQKGGSATVAGGSVSLAGTARIDARGSAGGGTVRVGGGPHGADKSVRNATTTTVAAGAVIDASATGTGNGGQITVWSDTTTAFNGTILSQGGPAGGNGGTIETSGQGQLVVGSLASVSAAATKGAPGLWLLDPDSDLTITTSSSPPSTCSGAPTLVCVPNTNNSTVSVNTINTALNNGTSVAVITFNPNGTQQGNIFVGATAGGTDGQIMLLPSASSSPPVTLELDAGAGYTVPGAPPATGTGAIIVNSPITDRGSPKNLSLVFNAGGSITFNNNVDIAGTLLATAGINSTTGGISINSPITSSEPAPTYGVALFSMGPITENAGGSIDVAYLRARTQNNPGAAISLNSTGNNVGHVTLTALNGAGNALAAGPISFADSSNASTFGGLVTAFVLPASAGTPPGGPSHLELGVSTASSVVLSQLGGPLALEGPLTAGTTVALNATGTISESFATGGGVTLPGTITAATLTGSSIGGAALNNANLLTNLGAFTNAGPGGFTLTNGQALNVTGPLNAGTGAATLTTTSGNLVVGASLTAGTTMTLASAGAITEQPGGAITAQNLVARTISDPFAPITLNNPGNVVPGNVTLSTLNSDALPAAGPISFSDNTGFTVAALNNQEIGINTTGAVLLQTSGALAETGAIAANLLDVEAVGPVSLAGANNVGTLVFHVTGAGNSFLFRNDLQNLTIGVDDGTTVSTNGGALTVVTTRAASLAIPQLESVLSNGGNITLTAGGSGAAFVNGGLINSTSAAPAAAGNIAILADFMSLSAGTIKASTVGAAGTVVLGPVTASDTIVLGPPPPPPIIGLGLTQSDLNSISAGQLQIGYRNTDGMPSLTGNINITSPITVNTSQVPSLLLVTGGSVTQNSGATITKLIPTSPPSAPPPLSLGVIAGGPVTLGEANQVDTVAGYVDGGTNSFLFRNNSAALTIGSLPKSTLGVAFDATGIPSTAAMAGPAPNPLSGITTQAGGLTVSVTGPGTTGFPLTVATPVLSVSGPTVLTAAGTGGSLAVNAAVGNATSGSMTLTGGSGGILINAPITSGQNATVYGVNLVSTGPIAEGSAGSIAVAALRALTENDSGAAIALTNSANAVPVNVTLTTLNGSGTNPARGNISFVNSTGFDIDSVLGGGQGGLELGANTTGNIFLSAGGPLTIVSPVNTVGTGAAPPASVTLAATGAISELGANAHITTADLLVTTQNNSGAAITLNNIANSVGNVMLNALNGTGAAPAAGAINFIDSTGFTLAGVTTAAGATLQADGALRETGAIVAQDLVARTQLDGGATIMLSNAGNRVPGNVTLSALNGAGTAAAASAITFVDSTGVTVAGVTTAAGATLQAGGALQETGAIVAQDLVVRTQLDGGAAIVLSNAGNRVPGNVTLNALNGAGTVAAAGAITFVDSTGFTVAAQPRNEVGNQESGVNTTVSAAITAGGPLLETGAIAANDLTVVSQGPVSLSGQNAVNTLAGRVTGSGNSFLFRNDNHTLTIGGDGVTTNNGDIALGTTTSGNLVLSQSVNANNGSSVLTGETGLVGLLSAGNITQSVTGVITASELGILSKERVSLGAFVGPADQGAANLVAKLAGQVIDAGESFVFRSVAPTLTIDTVKAPGTLPGNFLPSELSGVVTNNANIGLRATAPNSVLALAAPVNANGGGVGLESNGRVQMAGPISGALQISSTDSVSLAATGPVTLSAQITGAGNSFQFQTVGGTLTVGSSSALLEQGTGTPPNNQMLSVGGLVGVTTNNGNITLRTTTSGDIVLNRPASAGTGVIALNSAGMISEQPGATITAATLTGNSVGAANLNQTNQLTNLGPFINSGRGGFSLTNGQQLNVIGAVNAGTGSLALTTTNGNLVVGDSLTAGTTVALNSAGAMTEPAGGQIAAATLTGSSVGGANLNQTNQLTNLGPFTNSGAGGFALTDGQTLNLTGAVNAGTGGLALTTTIGNLVVGAGLGAGATVALNSAGAITEPAGGQITAATLTGSSVGGANLNQTNQLANLGPFTNSGAGGFALTDGQTLNLTGAVNAGTGALALTTTNGNLVVGAGLTAGTTVALTSAGTISEPAGGLITAGTLTGSSAGGASLTQANQVASFGPFNNTTSGLLSFTDAQPLTTAGAVNSAGGLTLTTTGGSNLTLGANLTSSGQMTLTSAGNITEVNDPVITASDLTVGAAGKVSLGIDGGTVFPANANMVGTLTGSAGGSFGFLNATALTVRTITASGDVLIQVNNGQPLTLAGNITAGGRAILDTGGAFSQVGTASVNAPVLAIDSTGSGVNTLLGFIPSSNVNASVISNLPPAGRSSNPIRFENLLAPNAVVLLFADQGSVTSVMGTTIQVEQLGLSATGSFADLQGSINGVSGPTAALLGVRAPGPDPTYVFNNCIIAAATCVVIPPNQPLAFLVAQPQTASEIQELSVSPNLSAQFVLIEPEIVKGVRQSEDPDTPVINIFDEERLCDETAKSQPTKEPCREER